MSEKMTDDPHVAASASLLLDRLLPTLELCKAFMMEKYPDDDDPEQVAWMNGMLFGAVATYMRTHVPETTLDEIAGVYVATVEAFEGMIDAGSLDAYVGDVLKRAGAEWSEEVSDV